MEGSLIEGAKWTYGWIPSWNCFEVCVKPDNNLLKCTLSQKKSRKGLTPLKWYLLFFISFLSLLSAMGIYKLSNKAEEIQETTMTDPLEKTISWEWVEKIQNIFYQWLKMSIRNITNNIKFSVIKGVFLMPSWQTFASILFFSHECYCKPSSSLRN